MSSRPADGQFEPPPSCGFCCSNRITGYFSHNLQQIGQLFQPQHVPTRCHMSGNLRQCGLRLHWDLCRRELRGRWAIVIHMSSVIVEPGTKAASIRLFLSRECCRAFFRPWIHQLHHPGATSHEPDRPVVLLQDDLADRYNCPFRRRTALRRLHSRFPGGRSTWLCLQCRWRAHIGVFNGIGQ